jgi:hypothetical protein
MYQADVQQMLKTASNLYTTSPILTKKAEIKKPRGGGVRSGRSDGIRCARSDIGCWHVECRRERTTEVTFSHNH